MIKGFFLREWILRQMMAAPSPSGFEQPLQKIWERHAESFCDRVSRDVLGNVLGIINREGLPRVMISAHCDEIGMIVNHIDEKGFLYCKGVVESSLLPGHRVLIHTKKGPVCGVVGKKPTHLMSDSEKNKRTASKLHDLYVDIGASGENEARESVAVGDFATFAEGYLRFPNDLIVSRGFDNKISSFAVAEILRYLYFRKEDMEAGVFGVSSVQEEVGCRGVRPAAFGIEPQAGIVLDATFASDTPDISKRMAGDIKLGHGPVLFKGGSANPVVMEIFQIVAQKRDIPYQIAADYTASGTEVNHLQLSRSGVATALVGIPCRYMHTPSEVVSLKDVKNAVFLVAEFILRLGENSDFIPN